MKSATAFRSLYLWLLPALICLFASLPTPAFAQPITAQLGVTTTATILGGAPLGTQLPTQPGSTHLLPAARKEDDPTEPAAPGAASTAAPPAPAPHPGAAANSNRLNLIQRAAAAMAGIPTDTALLTENARLTTDLNAAAAALATVTAERDLARIALSAASAEATALRADLAAIDNAIGTFSAAPQGIHAARENPEAAATLAAVVATPAGATAAAAVATGVSRQLQTIGQPAAQLPQPKGASSAAAAAPACAADPSAESREFFASYWKGKGLDPKRFARAAN